MRFQRKAVRRPVKQNCMFCHNSTEPYFRDTETLSRFMSDRGRILAHTRSGICSKHQRALSASIKHARHIALLPFVVT
ncbi:30S ribosomal protein S18 [Candidatus Microgenomates bacterium]|nr:MAG: 30S ribosomal protein S18 [Candidatus Microgenomates bacterium]